MNVTLNLMYPEHLVTKQEGKGSFYTLDIKKQSKNQIRLQNNCKNIFKGG